MSQCCSVHVQFFKFNKNTNRNAQNGLLVPRLVPGTVWLKSCITQWWQTQQCPSLLCWGQCLDTKNVISECYFLNLIKDNECMSNQICLLSSLCHVYIWEYFHLLFSPLLIHILFISCFSNERQWVDESGQHVRFDCLTWDVIWKDGILMQTAWDSAMSHTHQSCDPLVSNHLDMAIDQLILHLHILISLLLQTN